MSTFTAGDGRRLMVCPGFREAVLRARPSGTPQAGWTAEDYERTAVRRVAAARTRLREALAELGAATPVRALEVGCGAAVESLVAAHDGMVQIVAVDRRPALCDAGERGERSRRLADAALRAAGSAKGVQDALMSLPISIRTADVTALDLPDGSIDLVWSRAALEHVQPLATALRELARVVRPGGVAHHVVDPFGWVKGCHAGALIDLPWAHVRLTPEDFSRAAAALHGRRRGARRAAYLAELNPLGLDAWREALVADGAWELIRWQPAPSALAEQLLLEHPDVAGSVLPPLTGDDLVSQSVTAVLRRRDVRQIHALT